MEKNVKLLCLRCLKWSFEGKVKYLSEDIRCPVCGARTIAVLSQHDDVDSVKKLLLDERCRKRKLSNEEVKKLDRIKKTALLVLKYGKKAVIVLSGKGIGPTTAIKVLNEAKEGGDVALYTAILKAEREYARTRPFWED